MRSLVALLCTPKARYNIQSVEEMRFRTIGAAAGVLAFTLLIDGTAIRAQQDDEETGATAAGERSVPSMPISVAIEDRNHDTIPDRLGQAVHVRGVVVIGTGVMADDRLQVYIQDASAGIYLFARRMRGPALTTGDVVDVTGLVDQYRGAVQIFQPRYAVVGHVTAPRPVRIAVREAASWKNYGRLVEVEGTVDRPREEGPNTSIPLQAGGAEIRLLLPPKVLRRFPLASMPPGSKVSAAGVVSIYSTDRPYREGWRLIISDPASIHLLARPVPVWIRRAVMVAVATVLVAVAVFALFRVVRRRAVQRERHIAVLNALSGTVASRMGDVDALLTDATEIMSRHGLVDGAVIHLLEGKQLRLRGAYGVEREKVRLVDEQVQSRVGAAFQSRPPAQGPTEMSALTLESSARLHPLLCVPLQGRSRTIGVLTVFTVTRHSPTPTEAATIAAAANLIALGIENIQILDQAEQRQEELKQLAITDPLTGLYNRRFLDEYLRIHLPMSRRQSAPVSFIAIDLDHFKRVNDEHGHEAGDVLLSEVGKTLRRMTRASDLPVRLGGEEFLIVMPGINESGAVTFATRLQNELRGSQFHVGNSPIRLTASFGVAIYPDHGENVRQLLRVVDEALYDSKRAGRDRITVAPAPFRITEGEAPAES